MIATLVTGMSAPAAADPAPCALGLDRWEATQGDLQPGRTCGSFIAATNGATLAYSFGQVTWRAPVTVPYRMSLTWRRLGSDTRPIELQLLGAVVLFAEDEVALWIDDPTFELDGWHPLPGYRTRRQHRVSVEQRVDAVEVAVDGVVVGRWRLRAPTTAGPIAVAFKGHRGARERLWFTDVAIVPLGQGQASPAGRRSK